MSPQRKVAIWSLAAIASFAVGACGNGESSSPTTAPTVSAEPPATEPPATEPPADEPDLATVFTVDDLIPALPAPDGLGAPWTGIGDDDITVDPPVGEGLGVGTCGGPNAMGRATPNGVVAVAQSRLAEQPDGLAAWTTLYAFEDAEGASGFIATSAEVIDCPDGVTWERVQRTAATNPDEFNGFAPGFEEVVDGEIWTFDEFAASEYLPEPDLGADEVMYFGIDQDRQLTAVEITFAQTQGIVGRYARYSNVVILTQLRGNGNYEGWLNIDELVDSLPEFEQLDEYVILAEPFASAALGLAE